MERRLYDQMLESVGAQIWPERSAKLTLSPARAGNSYSRHKELMVVGRAPNGWKIAGLDANDSEPGFHPADLLNPGYRAEIVQKALCEDADPMDWLGISWAGEDRGYYAKRSAFWRVASAVLAKYADVHDGNWHSHVTWSNLYKVAPAKQGNPSNRLCAVQLETARLLFKHEIRKYRPKRILIMAGSDWAKDFDLGDELDGPPPPESHFVEFAKSISFAPDYEAQVVVSQHPARKPGDQLIIDEIERAFANLQAT